MMLANRKFCIYTGVLLVFCSLIVSTIILTIFDGIDNKTELTQSFIISNKSPNGLKKNITVELPFKWNWNYSQTQLHSMYRMKNSYYDMNQLLFNHSFILQINWNFIKYISSLSLFNESNDNMLKRNFFAFLTDLDNPPQSKFSLSSIVACKWNTYPNLGYCGAQFYPQLLYYHNGTSAMSYLRVDNVIVVKETSLNMKQQLIIWIFIVNPFVYQDFTTNEYKNQSHYISQLLQQTKYLLCVFNFKISGANKTLTTLSLKIQAPDKLQDRYAIIKCKLPLLLYKYLDRMTKKRHIYTPFQVTLLDPFQLFYAQSNKHNISYITVPICPNYVINNGMNIHSMLQSTEKVVPPSLKQSGDLIKHKKHKMGACVILHVIEGDIYSFDKTQIIEKVHEWMEFLMHIVGVEHFYFYQHIDIYDHDDDIEKQSAFMWNEIIGPYFKAFGSKLITYIKWAKPFNIQFTFQLSAMNSCIRQFAQDNKYLFMADIDELFIPKLFGSNKTNKMSVYDIVNEIDNNYTNKIFGEFGVDCDIGITCQDEWGCDRNKHMFNTFIQRHQCIMNSEEYNGDPHKVIVNPDLVEYQFVHYVDTFRVLNQQYVQKQYDSQKYLVSSSNRDLFNFNLRQYVLCNHMKESLEIFHKMKGIDHLNVMDTIVKYFTHKVLNNSQVYNQVHNINHMTVLPYIQLVSQRSFCHHK